MRSMWKIMAGGFSGLALVLCCWASAAPPEARQDAGNLFVFIGQKVSMVKQAEKPTRCDNCIVLGNAHYLATYRILESVFGNYRGGDITFDVYDHYGLPRFSSYDTVMLFVSQQPDGSWLHEKYQYVDLYRGLDGQWYGCGNPYRNAKAPPGVASPRPVFFATPVSYSLDKLSADVVELHYPAAYFDIRDGRAYCRMGATVDELFQAKKDTVFKARGMFP